MQPEKLFVSRDDSHGSTGLFTASQIAKAVGVSPRAIRDTLAKVRAAGRLTRGGNECAGYAFESLPDRIQDKVRQQQEALNYRSPQAVLASPKPQWRPLSRPSDEAIEYAHLLKRALSFFLLHRNDTGFKAGELSRIALRDYAQTFGRGVGKRRVERLVNMVIHRDGGREEFNRLEIYLPHESAREAKLKPESRGAREFPRIEDAIEIIQDLASPTPQDRGAIWRAALEEFDACAEEGWNPKEAKSLILAFLGVRVPRLAESANALRMQFERKLAAFRVEGVSALCDRRRERSGRRTRKAYDCPESLSEDERMLAALANSVGGGLSQAFRELYMGVEIVPGQRMQFSAAFRASYGFNPRENKSYVPQGLRDKLRPLLKSIEPLNLGPKAARLAAPSIHRDWSNVLAGDWFQSDDETANHYVWIESETGDYEYDGLRFDVLRPQILPMVDIRTDYVLSFLLLPQPNYNSRAIRSLILKTCMDEKFGLPFLGFYFEQGIWKARNIQALVEWTAIDDAFARSGLELKLRHATTPRAKTVERIFAMEQNITQALPGYTGRDERNDCPEETKRFKDSLKRVGQPRKAEVAPWDGLLSVERYLDQLQRAYERFNNEPQNGKRLCGMSPAEAWKELSGGRAHCVVPDSLRYLLATEQSEQRVTREGLCIRIGKAKRYYYESDRLGTMTGERVIVRWNQDLPDHVVVVHPKSDPQAMKPFVVKHAPELAAMNADQDAFAAARRSQKVFTEPARSLFRALNHNYGRTLRNELLGNDPLRQAGHAHNAVEREHIELANARKSDDAKARKLAHRAGFNGAKIRDHSRAVQELEGFGDLEARLLKQEAANEQNP
ncbi:MAG TPA: hypothetical protein VIS96_07135 [Terrimicrobiaceae bacterium]